MTPRVQAAVEAAIASKTGFPYAVRDTRAVGGGCINEAFSIAGDAGRYFLKLNAAQMADAFAAEADGLEALASRGMRVPSPIAHSAVDGRAFLVLEHLELGTGSPAGFRALGRALAALHTRAGPRFGWHRDNYIGATPQRNASEESWVDFWRTARLEPQLRLASIAGFGARLDSRAERLLDALPKLLEGHSPRPALLHGDLWSGNAGFLATGEPVVFDPAVYWGDREADLAMTELFGGFPAAFYEGYREMAPVDAGYAVRKVLYNLYHVLNHVNLFGAGYVPEAERMIDRLLAEAG